MSFIILYISFVHLFIEEFLSPLLLIYDSLIFFLFSIMIGLVDSENILESLFPHQIISYSCS